MNIGSRVKFNNKVLATETDVPLGSIGILCEIDDCALLNGDLMYYVVFNSMGISDWFIVNELEYLGEV